MLSLGISSPAASALFAAMEEASVHPDDVRLRRLVSFIAEELGVSAEVPKQIPSAELAALVPLNTAVETLERLALATMLVAPDR